MANDEMIGYSSAAYESFSSVYEGLSNASKADISTYVVQSSTETLRSIAKSIWGDERLWYVIADANGLTTSDAPLTVGQPLQIPAQAGTAFNGADTFKPYNAAEIIGSTTPEVALPVPQQAKGGGCGGLGQLVMVVVAVVATIYTAGAAAGLMGASGGAWTAGLAVMGGTSGLSATAAIAAGAIGGAMGSIASQAVGIAIGAQDGFNWKGVAMSAIGGGVSAGVAGTLGKAADIYGAMGRAALSNTITQGVSIATGLQNGFDWRGVAASAAGAGAGFKVGQAVSGLKIDDIFKQTASGMASGATAAIAHGGKIDMVRVAVDAFGNALGNSLVQQMRISDARTAKLAAMDKRVDEIMAETRPNRDLLAFESPDPRDYRRWSVKDSGGKLTPNPNGPDYPTDRLLDGTQFTKQTYTGNDGASYPVIQTSDGRVLAYPGSAEISDVARVVVTGQRLSLEQQLDLRVSEMFERNNAELDQNLNALTQSLQANPVQFDIAPTPAQALTQDFLNAVGSNAYVGETIGLQSLPGTIDGLKDIATSSAGVYSARNFRTTYVTPRPNGTGAVITTNRSPVNGTPRVTVTYGVTRPSAVAQLGEAAGGVFKKAPLLSLLGTGIEYGAYHYAGLNKNGYGDSRYTFAADATLDAGKAVVSGGAGALGAIIASAGVGALGGSAVPGLGTVIGGVAGLAIGIYTAVQFENEVYTRYNVRQSFADYLQSKFR
jgi:hypothetical protein